MKAEDFTHIVRRCVTDADELAALLPVLDAFEQGRYKFICEPWAAPEKVVANELLLRVFDGQGGELPFKCLFDMAEKYGLQEELDRFLVREELEWLAQYKTIWPVTLNISVLSALSPGFWAEMEPAVTAIGPANVVFEILEHDVPANADLSVVLDKCAQGYQFALDDFTLAPRDRKRLEFFAAVLDFVKFDGAFLRQCLDDEALLDEAMTEITAHAPSARLIAEWATSEKELSHLFNKGFFAVQSRELKVHPYFSYKKDWKDICPS